MANRAPIRTNTAYVVIPLSIAGIIGTIWDLSDGKITIEGRALMDQKPREFEGAEALIIGGLALLAFSIILFVAIYSIRQNKKSNHYEAPGDW